MTNQEIAKSLRCCSYPHTEASECDPCPCVNDPESCATLDLKAADMIEAQEVIINMLRSKLNELQEEVYIKESFSSGKAYRECSKCGTDVTQETMWMNYSYCPHCGGKVNKNVGHRGIV